ncbi:hypothetical protein M407DRAFT_234206 [Tulasnella calospora MUT 4182]|uniref:Major facilitator superfamily (MFS) profile domain-containing protein n=1 Tax=Tulasnella calospora MUT 4182 TaxID=1051891 RepID=A0A0C3Q9N1_9AGAM|nr:hypothetical protein M407DRAFT_234206 [Tulasnella calospora MUT 4182]
MEFEREVTLVNEDAEAQPLLPKKPVTPLPKFQLAIVLFARLAEPIAYTQIFPYINAMVEELHIAPPKQVGFYSGLIDSLFALTQLCTIVHWGSLSDRIGRRPVILIGLSGVSVATLFFGLSNTLWQLLLSRALIGALCGNVAVIQSVVSDITDETNQNKAFPLPALVWYMGAMIGPLIGGLLSHPAERYPNVFGGIPLLKERPFFLPCFISVLITITAMLSTVFFLEESLPRITRAKRLKSPSDTEVSSQASFDEEDSQKLGASARGRQKFGLLSNPAVRRVACAGFFMAFLLIGFDTVFVLWSYTPLSLGGLQRKPAEIGLLLSVVGTFGIASTTVIFPYLHERFKSVPLFAACVTFFGLVYAMVPFVGLVVRKVLPPVLPEQPAPPLKGLWGLVLALLVVARAGGMAFPAYLLVVKEAMPDPESVGALYGLATAASCLGEGTAPAFVSSLFALSVDKHLLGGNLVWIVMAGLGIFAAWFAQSLRQRN